MRTPAAQRQRGAALLVLAAILVLGISWMMITALGNASQRTTSNREHDARVLAEAKAALSAWVAINALDGTENNPGRLPCPQAWGDIGSVNEGRAASNCSVPAAGWLPWRTLGIPKPLDASGNQIWYVISPGWHLPTVVSTLTINSNTAGQLTLDGQAAVALLIAPGPPLAIAPNANQLAAGCTARNQSQALSLPTAPNPLDFLDCQNGTTADNVFTASVVDNAANSVFNDQVLAITTADILPPLEAAIAKRIERDIAPVLKSVYASATWGTTSTNPAFAFPAPFGDPTASNYQGQNALPYRGLLPFNYHSGSCAGDARCSSDSISWGPPSLSASGGPGYLPSAPNCYVSGSTPICEGYYYGGTLDIAMADPAADITKGLRTFTASDHTATGWRWTWNGSSWLGPYALTATLTRSLASSGAANFVASASLASVATWGYYLIQASRPTISDHPILSAATANTGWFMRNEWYRLLYYAIATNHAAGGTLACTTGTNCLSVANVAPADAQRAIVILAGRSVNGTPRPSTTIGDYLEQGNATGAFVQQSVSLATPFNDRVVVVDTNP